MTSARDLVLDAYALLAFLRDEPAAEDVDRLLHSGARLYMSSINVGEVFYKTMRERGIDLAQQALMFVDSVSIEIVDPDRDLVLAAAYLKGLHPISYADCFAAALAMRMNATLVTGDKDFERLQGQLAIEWLPSQ